MSEDDFLARWSRRKQAARGGHAEPKPEQPVEAHAPAASDPDVAEPCPTEADLSRLTPLDSICAATDVSAFLRKGIPQELSRAALRRAWTADSAIRDFIGLAESAWDFNDPAAMPGFGPLDYSAEQIDALVRRVVGEVVEAAGNATNALAQTVEDTTRPTPAGDDLAQASGRVKPFAESSPVDEAATADPVPDSAAPQLPAASEDTPVRHRTHGGALPR